MLYKEYLQNRRVYQEQGTQLLIEKKHACLFYKPGKGKTYPVVEACQEVNKLKQGKCRVLILSTKDAIDNMWDAEIMPQNIMPENTVLMTINGAIQEKTKCQLLSVAWDIIIVDECHKIKSHNSKISKLVFLLTRKCEYAWGLTGTPRGNNDADIFCQLHNLNVSEWGCVSYTQFVSEMCIVDTKYFNGRTIMQPVGIKKEYKTGWENNLSQFTQRIDYDEQDDMPELKVDVIKLPFEPDKVYKEAEQGIIQIPDYETTMTKLVAITKMHQAANGYIYTDTNGIRTTYRFADKNAKIEWLKNNIISKPTVIVYQFAADLEDLKNMLKTCWYTESVEEFKNMVGGVLLLQCSRCESFNLQMCNTIIFYTMDYSYIKYNQMIHRVWRMGQTNDVNIKILLYENSVEEQIWSAVRNKEKAADLFMSIKEKLL